MDNVVSMEDRRNSYKILIANLEGRDSLGVLGVDGEIILEWILNESM
jgi:hypothetical protein